MTTEQKYLARLLLQNKIYSCDAASFQKLFVSIMQLSDKDFNPIKPHGSLGDRKNDGFNKRTGTYYQVYAPEDSRITHNTAVNKCKEDFNGLKTYWNTISPLKQFYFTLNDKYTGAFPELHKALSELEGQHKVKCDPFLAKDLEDTYLELTEDNIVSVVGIIPNSEKIEQIDYSAMTQVVNHLLEGMKLYDADENYNLPDFSEKIQFNGLSEMVASLLTVASYQSSVLEDFFERNSIYFRQALKETFKTVYDEGRELFGTNPDNGDAVFMHILKRASPKDTKQVNDAVLVLMAYYFESCDIFEEPKMR